MPKRILVTGASGFVGRALCKRLVSDGYKVTAATRGVEANQADPALHYIQVADVSGATDWTAALSPFVGGTRFPVDCIVHCAGRAHVMGEGQAFQNNPYFETNVFGTEQLAKAAASAGVGRFVFLSSIKVNGEETLDLKSFSEGDLPSPEDDYGRSKWEAEKRLWGVSYASDMGVTVVRMPLVYGPGVKGNLARLLSAVSRGLPLPLGRADNRRAMIGVSNLVDFLVRCVWHPSAVGKTFLVSDSEEVSTGELVRLMALGMGRRAPLLNLPLWLPRAIATVLGKKAEVNRLLGSLRVDSRFARKTLEWQPPLPLEDGIRDMALEYASMRGGRP